MDYQIDPVKQAIADSWPNSMDDSCAREEWGWKPEYNLQNMTVDMLVKVKEKFDKGFIKTTSGLFPGPLFCFVSSDKTK